MVLIAIRGVLNVATLWSTTDNVTFICYPFLALKLAICTFFKFWHLFWRLNWSRTKYDINKIYDSNYPLPTMPNNATGTILLWRHHFLWMNLVHFVAIGSTCLLENIVKLLIHISQNGTPSSNMTYEFHFIHTYIHIYIYIYIYIHIWHFVRPRWQFVRPLRCLW